MLEKGSGPASSAGPSTHDARDGLTKRLGLRPTAVPGIENQELERVEELAWSLRAERKDLTLAETFHPLAMDEWRDAPTFHLDDQSAIAPGGARHDTSYMQDRSRIRAFEGDIVVCNQLADEGYEEYCREMLGLGQVEWVAAESQRYRRHLAGHCWTKRPVRRRLIQEIKSGGLRYIHPLMGSAAVWQLALLLERSSRRPVKVLAPPPGLARFVNDKTEFTRVVARLFGERSLPMSRTGSSLAVIVSHVRELGEAYARLGLKLPDAAGGAGNLVLPTKGLRGLSLDELRLKLAPLLRGLGWQSGDPTLVSGWESHVLCAPSIQVWIPPGQEELPWVEGVFEQSLAGASYEFVGTRPASFPPAVQERILTRGFLLASLFQKLGYVGRCSFDLVLIGNVLEKSRAELIECNGRWGGTSYPMSLVHRLFAGKRIPHYIVRSLVLPGIRELGFRRLLEHFEKELFDIRTGQGWLVLFNPARIQARSGITYIALGDSPDEAVQRAEAELPGSLQELLRFQRRHRTRVSLP